MKIINLYKSVTSPSALKNKANCNDKAAGWFKVSDFRLNLFAEFCLKRGCVVNCNLSLLPFGLSLKRTEQSQYAQIWTLLNVLYIYFTYYQSWFICHSYFRINFFVKSNLFLLVIIRKFQFLLYTLFKL